MRLFTYRTQSSVDGIKRKGALLPRRRLGRRSILSYAFNLVCGISDQVPPIFSLEKVIFAFPEGYERTRWLSTQLLIPTRTPLEFVLCNARDNDPKEGPVCLFSFEPLPSDKIYVLDYEKLRISMRRETLGENQYYDSAVPLSEYGGTYVMPEAVCLSPISKSRLHLEERIGSVQELASHVDSLMRKAAAKPEPSPQKPKPIVKDWTDECPFILG